MPTLLTPDKLSAGRMGELLANSRLDAEVDLERLAAHSSFTVGELSDIEAGHRLLRPEQLSHVASLYQADCGLIIPNRHPLRIDLVDGVISADGNSITLDALDDAHVLDRYLTLVYSMRNLQLGAALHLRDEDIETLADSLSEREDFVVERLHQAIDAAARPSRRFPSLHHALRMGTLPSLAGLVSIGAVLLVTGEDAVAETSEAEPPELEPAQASQIRERITLREAVTSRPDAEVSGNVGDDVPFANASDDPTELTIYPEWPVWGGALIGDSEAPTSVRASVADDLEQHSATTTGEAMPIADVEAPEVAPVIEQMPIAPDEMYGAVEEYFPIPVAELLPGWSVNYLPERPGLRGLTLWETQTIEIYVRSSDTPESLAPILAHEVGHAVDIMYLQDVDRHAWLQARGIAIRTWWPGSSAPDFATGAGDFAEAFAYWSVGDPSRSQLAGNPTQEQLALMGDFVARAKLAR